MKKNWLIFPCIIFVALVLRSTWLSSVPPSLNWDEVAIGWNAKTIFHTRLDEYGTRLPLAFQSFGDFKSPALVYITAPFVGVFGYQPWAVRLPSVLLGMLAIVISFFLAKEVYLLVTVDKNVDWLPNSWIHVALVSMALLAISPWHIMYSRPAIEPNIAFTCLILGMWLFLWGIRIQKHHTKAFFMSRLPISMHIGLLWLGSGLSFVASLYSYHSPKLIVPLLGILLGIIFVKELLAYARTYWWVLLFIIFICGLAAYPIIAESLYGRGAERSGVLVFYDKEGNIRPIGLELVQDIAYNTLAHLSPSMYLQGDTKNLRTTLKDWGMLNPTQWLLAVIGSIAMLWLIVTKKGESRMFVFLFGWFMIGLVPGIISQTQDVPHPLRSYNALAPLILIITFGLFWVLYYLKQRLHIDLQQGVIWLLIGMMCIEIGLFGYRYFISFPVYAAVDWQYGYDQAVDIAKEYEPEVEQIILTSTYGQPYIFTYFFQARDPMDIFWGRMHKYLFRTVNWEGDQFLTNRLLIGTPEEIPDDIPAERGTIVDEVLFPDGSVAFRIVRTRDK